jgi:dTDP-4-dehydrorhamnose reductase
MPKWLIVGGNGLIGSFLADRCRATGAETLLSTRRQSVSDGYLFGDLDGGKFGNLVSADADVVFLCAGQTNMRACRDNPDQSYRVNVSGTVELAEQLARQGAFVVFLSSNTVFDGATPWPDELHLHSPVCEYGRQKSRAERLLMALPGAMSRVAVVRLSKVLSRESGIAAEFLRRVRCNEGCDAFDDLRMSPISLDYVADALIAIASRKQPGIFHLSGAEELSYAEFASRLARHANADSALIRAVSSTASGAEVLFRPVYPGLGMSRTRSELSIMPEDMSRVLKELTDN